MHSNPEAIFFDVSAEKQVKVETVITQSPLQNSLL